MEQWRRNMYVLGLAVFVANTCWSMVTPFLPVFLGEEMGVAHASAWAGITAFSGAACGVVSAPFWGAMGDRYGRRLMMLRAGFFLTLGYILWSLVQSPYQVLAVRVMIGLLSGFIPTAVALVAITTPSNQVGQALAFVQASAQGGVISGPLAGGILADTVGIRGSFLVAAATLFFFGFLQVLRVKEKSEPTALAEPMHIGAALASTVRIPGLVPLLIATSISAASLAAMEPIMVPFAKSLVGPDAPNWVAGLVYSLPGVAFVLSASWWSGRGLRWGYHTTLSLGLGLAGIAVLAQVLAPTIALFATLRAVQGLAVGAVQPGIAALIVGTVPAPSRGKAFGMNQSANALGYALGPLVGGLLGTWAGPRSVLLFTGVLLLAGTLWVRQSRPRSPAPAGTP